jgi:hypothetical protein
MLSAEWKQLSWSLPVIAHKHGVRAQVQKKAMVAKITVDSLVANAVLGLST